LQTILAERRPHQRQHAVGTVQPLIRLLPGMTTQVLHESTLSSHPEEE
jgi:hypothetical protein